MRTLKASPEGLKKIREAREAKGWSIDDERWLEEASYVLSHALNGRKRAVESVSIGTWKRFLYGTVGIKEVYFQAFCKVLSLHWEDVVAGSQARSIQFINYEKASLNSIDADLDSDDEDALGIETTELATQEILINQVDTLIRPPGFRERLSYSPSLIDPSKYLDVLKQELDALNDNGLQVKAVELLKHEIKRFCISAEIYFTLQFAESKRQSHFYYSCSSLVDYGISSYLDDDGWLLLLKMMGKVAQSSDSKFVRLFFIDPMNVANQFERELLGKIINVHLQNQVAVALFRQSNLTPELSYKRNIALMGDNTLLCATDQIQWDLNLSSLSEDIERARTQHEYFQRNADCIFYPGQTKMIKPVLRELFPIPGDLENDIFLYSRP